MEKPKILDPSKIIGFKVDRIEYQLTSKDCILYSLGIGFSEDPIKKEDLNFTYENAEDFQAFPAIIGPISHLINSRIVMEHPHLPEFSPMSLLHGEQWIEVFKPIKPDSKLYLEGELLDFEDKGSGTIFVSGCSFFDDDNNLLGKTRNVVFIRDIKGHKYKSTGIIKQFSILSKVPEDKTLIKHIVLPTKPNQALLYRLGGFDLNPLHVDQIMSEIGGFKIPILHGMCFYGMTYKALFQAFSPKNAENILGFNARFTSHVFPGETLEISIYNGGNSKLLVSVKTKERGKQVLIGEAFIKNSKF